MIQPGIFQDLHPDKLQNLYLQRYAWPGPIIAEEPKINTKLIIVIPCFNEPSVLESLESLYNCEAPKCDVEVIIVVNHAENETKEIKRYNQYTIQIINEWILNHRIEHLSFFVIKGFDLPEKQAGVGLARKIGMDEAVRRFEFLNIKKGIIACFDADCHCSSNYLKAVYQFYQTTPETNAALVYFEHPLEGNLDNGVYDGIINYELHLRYYKNALQFAKFPYCFHTIGSCITVTSEVYQKQGGMNKRKAGEDFYFLQKIFPLGNISTINSGAVFPSPRPSNRVPFGTGKAINDFLGNEGISYATYNPKTFNDLRILVEKVSKLYWKKNSESIINELPLSIQEYLSKIHFLSHLSKIKKNSTSESHFLKSFYRWFNGFIVLKYVHYARDNYYKDINILEAVNWLLNEISTHKLSVKDKRKALMCLRDVDRSQ